MPRHAVQHEEACTIVLELAAALEASEQVCVDQMAKTEAVQAKCTRYAQLLRVTLSQNVKLRSHVTGMSAFLSLFVALSMTLEHSLGPKEARCRSLFKRFLDTRILLVMGMKKASARIRSLDAVVDIKMTTFNKLQAEHTATSSSYDNAINTADEPAKANKKKPDAAAALADVNHGNYIVANNLANVNHEKFTTEQTSRTTDKQIADTRYMALEQSKDAANKLAEVNYLGTSNTRPHTTTSARAMQLSLRS
ncbi:uncharacterized protein J4E92_009124 [Alternaria infectoria]|uniref:uncharacterized protein n=1 Tax=Alternaria infectoria TaxID=45303 RepID=UPI00221EC962|nr:uncharacterized protein J4E92_009124 [Alternaria infectoria]KAI4916620.1 hypothetical protein J4E92_009124 [Alternaria infectoria]